MQERRVTLHTNFRMPLVALDTWDMRKEDIHRILTETVTAGFRHLDCAYFNNNEAQIGKSFRKLFERKVLKRDDLYVTSKLWNTFHSKTMAKAGLIKSLNALELDYIDLYIMHWPMAFEEGPDLFPTSTSREIKNTDIDYLETWQVMETFVDKNLVRSLGVANFNQEQLSRLLENCRRKPAVLQLECNPYIWQEKLVDFAQANGIQVMAYSPIGVAENPLKGGKRPFLLNDPILCSIAEKHGKTPSQIALRANLQRNVGAIVACNEGSEAPKEAYNTFNFELTESEMASIAALDMQVRVFNLIDAKNNKYYPF